MNGEGQTVQRDGQVQMRREEVEASDLSGEMFIPTKKKA